MIVAYHCQLELQVSDVGESFTVAIFSCSTIFPCKHFCYTVDENKSHESVCISVHSTA